MLAILSIQPLDPSTRSRLSIHPTKPSTARVWRAKLLACKLRCHHDAMNPTVKGIAYVSVWVMLWGTAASLADFVLLQRDAYATGSSGQLITFASYGAACVVLAVRLANRFLKPQS